eukprot:gene6034-24849_t
MDGGQLRKQALQKLPRAWCRWWYGAVEGGGDDDGAGAVAEYCVEGDGHISAFLLNNLPLDASAVHKEINAVLAGAGMTFSQTMVFAALPESLAKAGLTAYQPTTGQPFRMWVVVGTGGDTTSSGGGNSSGSSAAALSPSAPAKSAYAIQSLNKEHAAIVNEAWPYKSPWSPAMAVDVVTGQPVAWAVTRNDGSIGLLHTEEQHRKQGLAKAVVTDLVTKLRAKGFAEPYFYVSKGNEGSEKVCAGLGFSPMPGEGYVWLSYKT